MVAVKQSNYLSESNYDSSAPNALLIKKPGPDTTTQRLPLLRFRPGGVHPMTDRRGPTAQDASCEGSILSNLGHSIFKTNY